MTFRVGFAWTLVISVAGGCTGGGDDGSSGTDGTGGTDTDPTGATDSATGSTSGATDGGTTGGSTTDASTGSTGGSTGGGAGDSVRVLFRDDPADESDRRIFAVDVVDGVAGTPEPVTAPFTGDEVLGGISRSSSDLRWRTYDVVSTANSSRDLFVVDVAGTDLGTPVRVSGDPVPAPGIVVDVGFSPDSSVLAFVAGPDTSGGQDIYLVPVDGTQPGSTVRLNPDTTANDGVGGFDFSDDSTKIVYVGSIDDGIENVYIQNADPANPGAPVNVTGNTDANVDLGLPNWHGGTEWILYKSDVDADSVSEVFLVNVSGAPGTPIELDPADTFTVRGPGMAPDMSGYAYWHGDGLVGDLYFASFDGTSFGTPVLLNTIGAGTDVFAKDFYWSPDSSWLFYMAEHDTAGVRELYAVDMSGANPAQPAKVNGTLLADTDVQAPRMSPEGKHLYYFAAQETMNMEIFRVALSAGSIGADERLHAQTIHNSTELVFDGEVQAMFTGNLDGGDIQELYLADLTGASPTTVMASAPTADGVTFGAQFSRDGRFITYSGSTMSRPIYLVDLDGAGAGTALEVTAASAFGPDRIINLP